MIIKVGEYEIHNSGTIMSFDQEPISFQISDNFLVRIVFKKDSSSSEALMEFENVKYGQIDIVLINFDNPLGIGNSSPLFLGFLKAKKMYLNFRVYSFEGNASKLLHYTWYEREQADEKEVQSLLQQQ